MKKIIYFLGLFLLSPALASAHVKWFVDTDEVLRSTPPTVFYNLQSKEILIWTSIVILAVLVAKFLNSKLSAPKKLIEFGIKNEQKINRVAQAILGVFLISVSFLWRIIIIPDFHITNTFLIILQYVQVLIGVMYLFNFKPKFASQMLLAFCVGILFSHGLMAFLENTILFTLALYFLIVNSEKDSWVHKKLNLRAVELVRIGTGVSLIILAFTEKFLYPELSLNFLSLHHWNFMQPLFPWFTDNLFVLSTGFAEMIFGILFIFGYITRVTTISIAIFFAMSVVTMFFQSQAWEVEDLVVYSAAILFIFFGNGNKK